MPTEIYQNFEWDSEKSIANLRKHNIDFYTACTIFSGIVVPVKEVTTENDEIRYLCIGELNGIFFSVVYTFRGERKRLISVRRAREDEKRFYSS
ncbi:MAG: BrnT family toxin [Rickettsiales bacterium]